MPEAPTAAGFEAELAVLADSAVRYYRNRAAAEAGTESGELVDQAFARAATIADRAEERAKARQTTACSKGCAWCCHQNVRVSAAEVFYLVRWLRAHRPAAEIEALATHAKEAAARLRGMPQSARSRARIACVLLDPATGACGVHEARPLLCRGQLSVSAQTCRQAVEFPEEHHFEPLLDAIHGAGLASMSLELEFAFLGGGPISGELTAMLATGLTDATARARWLDDENPFPRHNEFSTHLNSRMARMLAAAWAELGSELRDETKDAPKIRAAAMKFLKRVTAVEEPPH